MPAFVAKSHFDPVGGVISDIATIWTERIRFSRRPKLRAGLCETKGEKGENANALFEVADVERKAKLIVSVVRPSTAQ